MATLIGSPKRSTVAIIGDATAVGAAALAAVLLGLRLAHLVQTGNALPVLLAVAPALFGADLVAALTHWVGDTFFDEATPIAGAIVAPFRLHHDDPGAFRRHGFAERNGTNAMVTIPLLLLGHHLLSRIDMTTAPSATRTVAIGLAATFSFVAILLASTTQIHAWAHDLHAPRPVRWLQSLGILLSPGRHGLHHHGAHDRSYGIVNGWSDTILDGTRVFRRAESLAVRLGVKCYRTEAR